MNPQAVILLAAESSGRVFALDPQMFIQVGAQLLNASLLAAILTYVLYKPVRGMLAKRTEKIKSQLDRASEDMATANELKLQYEKKLGEIDLERNEILESSHRLAARKARQVLEEAKHEANVIKERAAADIELERERVKDEMRQAIIEVSAAMASKFVSQSIDAEVEDRLFSETMAELEEATWQN